jgi:hypothetical protein
VPRRRFQDVFFVPSTVPILDFAPELPTHFGCGVSFFLLASEQASRAKNRWYETRSRVCTKHLLSVDRQTSQCQSGGAVRSIEVRSRITGAGPDEARPQSELVRVRSLRCQSLDWLTYGARRNSSVPKRRPLNRSWLIRASIPHGVQLVVGSALRQPRVESLVSNLLGDATSDRVSNQAHEVRACGVSEPVRMLADSCVQPAPQSCRIFQPVESLARSTGLS